MRMADTKKQSRPVSLELRDSSKGMDFGSMTSSSCSAESSYSYEDKCSQVKKKNGRLDVGPSQLLPAIGSFSAPQTPLSPRRAQPIPDTNLSPQRKTQTYEGLTMYIAPVSPRNAGPSKVQSPRGKSTVRSPGGRRISETGAPEGLRSPRPAAAPGNRGMASPSHQVLRSSHQKNVMDLSIELETVSLDDDSTKSQPAVEVQPAVNSNPKRRGGLFGRW
mmetsp:Transcript_9705/g.20465  ORF Transcript_9705/g.20465 Transcript_9705/m.20465 type:complete len:219 (+) Transcript_9705:44-700(+)